VPVPSADVDRVGLSPEGLMREALREAALATEHGDVPVGAVVARAGEILGRGHNRREIDGDPTAHAEMIAIREAARAVGIWRLEDCELYVTLEPCAMCAGAAVLARIARIVYAATDPKAGACGSVLEIAREERLNHRIEVEGGLLREEASELLRAFFRILRERGGEAESGPECPA
jgi:tRNA(adenine34) deaminase